MFGPNLKAAFQISPPKIGQFVSSYRKGYKFHIWFALFVWKVSWLNQKTSTRVHFVTLKGHANIGPKLKAAFQMSPPKIGKFLSSRRMGSKFQILLLSFLWKVNWVRRKTLRRVSFCDNERLWNVWVKPESSFPNQPTKNWSICFELPKRLQISYLICFVCLKGKLAEPKNLYKSSFCDTEGPCKHWAKTESSFPNEPPKNW